MENIIFSKHSELQMEIRGTNREEVIETIKTGEEIPAKYNRIAYRKNFSYNDIWEGKFYHIKQVMPIVVIEKNVKTVITVYTFYF